MKMRGLKHIGISVKNLEVSIPFYRDVLGLKQLSEPPGPGDKDPLAEKTVRVKDAISQVVLFELPDGTILELLEYSYPPSPIDEPMPQNAVGASHVAFDVEDIFEVVKELTAKGVTFWHEPRLIKGGPMANTWWCYFNDPDGIALEIMETVEG